MSDPGATVAPRPGRVLAKGLALFLIVNALFAALNPLPSLARISAYNAAWPGRARLPYADNPDRAYSLTLDSLDAMFASHEVAQSRPAGEYRVLLIGDSATWGWLLRPQDTLAGQLNGMDLRAQDGRRMRFYNLGYPIMSAAKDVLLLNRALAYQPDLVIWAVTLESLPRDKQFAHPLLQANAAEWNALAAPLGLPEAGAAAAAPFLERSIVGRRRELADLLRLQLYGVMWAATGVDQDYPAAYEPAQIDLEPDAGFHGLQPPVLQAGDLALDSLAAGVALARARGVEIALVNEPILVSRGRNSDVRYNFFYPRWAYDQYRPLLAGFARNAGVRYLDAWDVLPPAEFTNSAVHTTPAGARAFATRVAAWLRG